MSLDFIDNSISQLKNQPPSQDVSLPVITTSVQAVDQFLDACRTGNIQRIDEMLQKHEITTELRDAAGRPALSMVVMMPQPNTQVVEHLIKRGFHRPAAAVPVCEWRPLWLAVNHKAYDIANMLIHCGANVADGFDALVSGAVEDPTDSEFLQLLRPYTTRLVTNSFYAAYNEVGLDLAAMLHKAAVNHKSVIVLGLLTMDANIDVNHVSADTQHTILYDVVEWVRACEAGGRVPRVGEYDAIYRTVEYLLRAHADMNVHGSPVTALIPGIHEAGLWELLIKACEAQNLKNDYVHAALPTTERAIWEELKVAVEQGDVTRFEHLVRTYGLDKCNINYIDQLGKTLLITANGNLQMIDVLLRNGAHPAFGHQRNAYTETISWGTNAVPALRMMMSAYSCGFHRMANLRMIYMAIAVGHVAMVAELLMHNIPTFMPNNKGQVPLVQAVTLYLAASDKTPAKENLYNIIVLLLRAGVNTNITVNPETGETLRQYVRSRDARLDVLFN
jgi:hypothetical protein